MRPGAQPAGTHLARLSAAARRARRERVKRYQAATVDEAMRLMAAMGVREPRALTPAHLRRRVTTSDVRSYAEIFEWLSPGELLGDPPETWAADWAAASADRFGPVAAPVR